MSDFLHDNPSKESLHYTALLVSYQSYIARNGEAIADPEKQEIQREKRRLLSHTYRARHGNQRNVCMPLPPGWELGEQCVYCGSEENTEIDHVIPLTRGGAHAAFNLVAACGRCNRSKGNKMPLDWLSEQGIPIPKEVQAALDVHSTPYLESPEEEKVFRYIEIIEIAEDVLYTPNQLAGFLKVSVPTIQRWLKDGSLPGTMLKHRWYVRGIDLLNLGKPASQT